MSDTVAQSWLLIAIVLLIGVLLGWLAWRWLRGSGPTSEDETRDAPELPTSSADIGTADHKLGGHDTKYREKEPTGNAAHPIADTVANPVPGPAKAEPAPAPEGRPNIAAASGEPDDLRQIKGVGPKLNTLLGELGVTRFDQIAAWSDADVAEVDPYLGNFKGRIERDNWRDQAVYLAKGDVPGFEAKYGKL